MNNTYLAHYGVLGMKWGIRRYETADGHLTPAGKKRYGDDSPKHSVKGNLHRAAAANYNLNARTYDKLGNKALADRNRAAANASMQKAANADAKKAQKSQAKAERKEGLRKVDANLAKNKQTKRVAMDYHNLDELRFRQKYKTSKKTFAKRYVKSDGNTYGMGLKKAAIASFIVANSGPVSYYDLRGNNRTIEMGKKTAMKTLAADIAYSEAVTRIGYDKAEKKYNENKKD